MKVLIIEDDLLIAENLKENLQELGYEVLGVGSKLSEVNQLIKKATPDVCLVDIYLRGSQDTGIEIVKKLQKKVSLPIIYLTSMDDAMYRELAKETKPAAYLVKPASKTQIDIAIDFAITNFRNHQARIEALPTSRAELPSQYEVGADQESVFIKVGDRYQKINYADINYIEASGTYTNLHCASKTYLMSYNLGKVLESLQAPNLIRCHRSFAVNRAYVEAFDETALYVKSQGTIVAIPISRKKKEETMALLFKMKVL